MPAPSVAADVEWRECAALLRDDFASFAVWCFRELNPRAPLAMNWHVEVMAGKLAAVREGPIRRLMVCVPPGHLKSHLASILVSGLVPGPRPERPDRLRQLRPGPCRQIVARLPAHRHERPVSAALFDAVSPTRQAVPEFETTAQGCRIATSVGGVLTAHGLET